MLRKMFFLSVGIVSLNVILGSDQTTLSEEEESTLSVRRSARLREVSAAKAEEVKHPEREMYKTEPRKSVKRTIAEAEASAAAPGASLTSVEVRKRQLLKKDSHAGAESERVTVDDIQLKPGKGSTKETMFYWHIFTESQRRGYVSIIQSEFAGIGSGPSIQIFINKKDQGKHIGSCAYEAACVECGLPEVYAHMRKSNIASKKAATNAGFVIDKRYKGSQLLMVWRRLLRK